MCDLSFSSAFFINMGALVFGTWTLRIKKMSFWMTFLLISTKWPLCLFASFVNLFGGLFCKVFEYTSLILRSTFLVNLVPNPYSEAMSIFDVEVCFF